MKEVARLLGEMLAAGVVRDYALFGAVAQMRYTEAVVTLDADVLIALPPAETVDVLGPVYSFCASRGYLPEGESVRVGDWPVQFIPAFNSLTEWAVREAETDEIEGYPLRVVRADYLAAIAVQAGRPKDLTRVLALLESGRVKSQEIEALARRHSFEQAWSEFVRRFLIG